MSQPLTVECPTCGAPVEWKSDNKYRPFCSDRCKLIDLAPGPPRNMRSPATPWKTISSPPTCHLASIERNGPANPAGPFLQGRMKA